MAGTSYGTLMKPLLCLCNLPVSRTFRETLPSGDQPSIRAPTTCSLWTKPITSRHPVGANTRPIRMRTLAIRSLTPHFEHKLFLSATPHNGYRESFSALLEMLDSQRFACAVPPNRAQLDAVMVRRMKSELKLRWHRPMNIRQPPVNPIVPKRQSCVVNPKQV